jgi:putative addiction module component (TIGR02574 family)
MAPMTDDAMRILEAALALPEDERARLATVLRDSIAHDAAQDEIDAAILAEVKRRREDLRSGRTKAVSYDEIRRKLDAMIELGRQREASAG